MELDGACCLLMIFMGSERFELINVLFLIFFRRKDGLSEKALSPYCVVCVI